MHGASISERSLLLVYNIVHPFWILVFTQLQLTWQAFVQRLQLKWYGFVVRSASKLIRFFGHGYYLEQKDNCFLTSLVNCTLHGSTCSAVYSLFEPFYCLNSVQKLALAFVDESKKDCFFRHFSFRLDCSSFIFQAIIFGTEAKLSLSNSSAWKNVSSEAIFYGCRVVFNQVHSFLSI